ncbi:glutamine--tRNA ligase/YqeY domain fusion protein [Ilumatobacter coccineus]|uniref:Glutamine--tRNA ligase n=1 Tax=Ilumatobacter coccineus (strain NBRC 103263 / KCTC 29153 / YM16-304) TaxID=1313172 RepID=A0A6C7E6G4_ILUCY|nr:glutamine--tRNA ligase/YqeY domain fusion protein [Ilumatobacter coccineus]BAN01692.1 glutaminyl-tRNA synthetase [Ilumatobacter coccineus YM16-304]
MSGNDDHPAAANFVRELVIADGEQQTFGGRVQTRFPPEPNGYLHIGHGKAITIDFELAREFDGVCNLRFDDTNPESEDTTYVDAIIDDLAWLGYPVDKALYASDYFEQLYTWAVMFIENDLAYVDEQDGDTISEQRGGYGNPGIESPFRNRPVAESLDLFRRMRAGDFDDGGPVLRAKIDMQHENMQLRDPIMYRIRNAEHHRTGDAWKIYPTYDWAHGQSDAIEGVTHSLCTLEFDSHRALYDWYLDRIRELDGLPYEQPRQTEFARLELTHTVTSKRKLKQLIDDGIVDGWDDPRLPTLRGLRKRGYPAESIREFFEFIGVSRTNSRNEIELLESFVRRRLNAITQRRMAVLRPLKVVITNWPSNDDGSMHVEHMELVNNPENADDGTRQVPFSGEFWIEQDDFNADPPPKYYRLTPGREVRLRGAYFVTCESFDTDADGNVTQVNVTYDPETKGGNSPDGRKVKSTMHWVSTAHAVDASVALYERLFSAEVPGEATGDVMDDLDANSRELLTGCKVEPALADTAPGDVVQFERLGYFAHDPEQSMLFHRTVGLRDEWANIQKRKG